MAQKYVWKSGNGLKPYGDRNSDEKRVLKVRMGGNVDKKVGISAPFLCLPSPLPSLSFLSITRLLTIIIFKNAESLLLVAKWWPHWESMIKVFRRRRLWSTTARGRRKGITPVQKQLFGRNHNFCALNESAGISCVITYFKYHA